ncbi:D-lactate dehydrogenase [Penicillium taxi]|uniref:D-lactate dehydrogenase n=1 Tax=Penicillium taxi TaxID=168475 RepID=UPI002545B5A6|nr:D-lactate dehydrogenase [Penicillium taxi]KAJ5907821.1 D-lactate dehydrogenase [Penicillium taxi]
MASTNLAKLEVFFQEYPIKFTPPSSAEFSTAINIWNKSRRDRPLAVVHPASPSEVAAIVRFAKANAIPFTLRSGGHNLEGLTLVNDVLLIDLRGLNSVTVAADRKSATVQGGVPQGDLANKLWAEGLSTPIGSVPSVGYVGWAIYGGYGPFSSSWGLGVDQIISATVVNPNGDIVTADEDILQGIRGAGGLFGVIIDLTIKIYPLTSRFPPQLGIQQAVINTPAGRSFVALCAWNGSDVTEGERWIAKIADLAPILMNTVTSTTIPEWLAANGALIQETMYGSGFSHNIARITPTVAESIGRNLACMPTDPGAMYSVHQLRGPSAAPQSHLSVFATRKPHYMLEILGFAKDKEGEDQSVAWAHQMSEDIEKTDRSIVLPTVYLSVYNSSQARSSVELLKKAYGPHAEALRELKTSFDPDNVFSLTVPVLD